MSSIKRDVKKKVLPRPEGEKIFVSMSSPLSVSAPDFAEGFRSGLSAFLWGSSFGGDGANRVWKLGKRTWPFGVSTMVLSEARGLSLSLVIRGGIT